MPINSLRPTLVEVGRIRLGYKDPDKKQADRLEQFRFTSPAEHLIQELARLYGGECRPWHPQNGGPQQFEVFSEASDIPVYVPRQKIDPWLELWGGGKACLRRCDGDMESLRRVPCICAADGLPDGHKDRCKPTVRVNLMLAEMPGLQIWSLVSHGFNMCSRLAALAPFVAEVPMAVPGRLMIIKRSRNVFDPAENKVLKRDLIMPEILIDGVTARDWQIGGDALTQAIESASGAAKAELQQAQQRRAIEVGPAPLDGQARRDWIDQINQTTTREGLERFRSDLTQAGIDDVEIKNAYRLRKRLFDAIDQALLQIEAATDLDTLAGIRGALAKTELIAVNNSIIDAWKSKKAGLEAQREIDQRRQPEQAPPAADHDPLYDEAIRHGATPTQVDEAGSPAHWLAERDQAEHYDAEVEFNLIYAQAGKRGWTTAQTNDQIKLSCGVQKVSEATGQQLRRLRVALERGEDPNAYLADPQR